jgi:hypothetical protein
MWKNKDNFGTQNKEKFYKTIALPCLMYSSESRIFFYIWFVRLLALQPFLAYCASLG